MSILYEEGRETERKREGGREEEVGGKGNEKGKGMQEETRESIRF